MRSRQSLMTCLALTTLLMVDSPQAAKFYSPCKLWNSAWSEDPSLVISADDFPQGSAFRVDFENARRNWNRVRGMWLEFLDVDYQDDLEWEFSNSRSEVAFGTNADIGGLAAATAKVTRYCWNGGAIIESDIIFNSESAAWVNGVASARHPPRPGVDFRLTALHELGHAMGIEHENDVIAVMNETAESYWGGGETLRVFPFPDDMVGSRTLYPGSTTDVDVALSNFHWIDSNVTELIMPDERREVRRGEQLDIGYAVGNLGNSTVDASLVVVLSSNAVISAQDRVIDTSFVLVNPHVSKTQPLTNVVLDTAYSFSAPQTYGVLNYAVPIPANIAPGDYFVGVIIDAENAVAEHRESNNVLLLPGTVRIVN